MTFQTLQNDDNNGGETKRKDLETEIRSSWLGRRDSNPRMPVPKTGALPLGDAPLMRLIYVVCITDRFYRITEVFTTVRRTDAASLCRSCV